MSSWCVSFVRNVMPNIAKKQTESGGAFSLILPRGIRGASGGASHGTPLDRWGEALTAVHY